MPDRATVSFHKDGNQSVALRTENGGMEFVEYCEQYAKDLCQEMAHKDPQDLPLERLEPNTVIMDCARYIQVEGEYTDGAYIRTDDDLTLIPTNEQHGKTESGHWTIVLDHNVDRVRKVKID